MTALAERPVNPGALSRVDGAAGIRRSLRAQVARLESELLALDAPPGLARAPVHVHGARLIGAAELERVRDDLVRRIQESRFTDGPEQERKRILREKMLLDPRSHRGVTVSNADVGEPGCTRFTSWFRLRISGGCP